jgi:uncharacterized protein YeaO (DUF488 family)
MLRESSYSQLKTLPKDTLKIAVGYPSIFSPSDELLREFNDHKVKLMKHGTTESEARKKAWQLTNFETRYRHEVTSNPSVMNQLYEIKKLAKHNEVVLYCYCGKTPCHRFILIEMIHQLENTS